MKTVYKYHLPPRICAIETHLNAKPLHVHEQHGMVTIWMEVETEEPMGSLPLAVVGTGNPIPDKFPVYVGTAHLRPFVWHVYAPEGFHAN